MAKRHALFPRLRDPPLATCASSRNLCSTFFLPSQKQRLKCDGPDSIEAQDTSYLIWSSTAAAAVIFKLIIIYPVKSLVRMVFLQFVLVADQG